MWKMYDRLIGEIPASLTVEDYQIGLGWTTVRADGNAGIALTLGESSRPATLTESPKGKPLAEVAALVKSWHFAEASLGQAALNAWYNRWDKVSALPGFAPADTYTDENGAIKERDGFMDAAERVRGKKVAVIGHFPYIEEQLGSICDLSILERAPLPGDYPDSACEYILPEQDIVFITGMTFVNKTLPRLLRICERQTVFLVGPSVPVTPLLFEFGVHNLSGFVCVEPDRLAEFIRRGAHMGVFKMGHMVRVDAPDGRV